MKVYVASRASIPERSAMWRNLRGRGANIISTWIDEAAADETDSFGELWQRIGKEISQCDRLVLYVESNDFPLKGAFIEVGQALALNKQVIVVAPTVKLSGRTLSPMGSWMYHPNVEVISSVEKAVGLV